MRMSKVFLVVLFIGIILLIVDGIFSSEPTKKAKDSWYDQSLYNIMVLLKIPEKEIDSLLSLPTSPEVNLDSMTIVKGTKWFFVDERITVGIVFTYIGDCPIKSEIIFDLRGSRYKTLQKKFYGK